jgi:hypothetical protein
MDRAAKQLRLADFRDCIAAMPVRYQAFSSKRSTWKLLEKHPDIGLVIRELLPDVGDIQISRADLVHYGTENELTLFVFATIMWGYSAGMRGVNLKRISSEHKALAALLRKVRAENIEDWTKHTAGNRIDGVGLSTYTKFLHFLGVTVEGFPSLILDDRIVRVASNSQFDELADLCALRAHNARQKYVEYLRCMHKVARQLKVRAGNLEMFLFEFGLNLKSAIRPM